MERTSFNDNWQFKKETDKNFVSTTLPHDAMQLEDRVADAPSGPAGAYYTGNTYIYEKSFQLPEDWTQEKLILEIGGIYQKSSILLNGNLLKKVVYGYRPFLVDLTSAIKPGKNKLQIIADNSKIPNSRWYSGAGIYRSIWLWHGSKDSLLEQNVKITTISTSPAKIHVQLDSKQTNWKISILDGNQVCATEYGNDVIFKLPNAKYWSDESPFLYQCLIQNENDQLAVNFGVRQIAWQPGIGLQVNGKTTVLRGGCLHPDNGILGAASYQESEYRRVKRLKEYGYNAIRSAHNPASTELLEACDQLGMYVMDEMWDTWYKSKNQYDYANHFMSHYKGDVQAVIQRDYNHPSVIMYSIGNEVSEPAEEAGVKLSQNLVRLFHELDTTRPTTAGINLMILGMAATGNELIPGDGQKDGHEMDSTEYNKTVMEIGTQVNAFAINPKVDRATSPVLDSVDIAGYNYGTARYELDQTEHPERLIIGTETYPQDLNRNWNWVKRLPNIIGDFMWTAWDYLGEAGIGAWSHASDASDFFKPYPWKLADAGALDLNGNPTGEALWTKAIWHKTTRPLIAVQPLGYKVSPFKSAWRGTNALPTWT